MGAVSLAQKSDGYTVWWVAFGSAEVFQGGNGEILLGVALMPGKRLNGADIETFKMAILRPKNLFCFSILSILFKYTYDIAKEK